MNPRPFLAFGGLIVIGVGLFLLFQGGEDPGTTEVPDLPVVEQQQPAEAPAAQLNYELYDAIKDYFPEGDTGALAVIDPDGSESVIGDRTATVYDVVSGEPIGEVGFVAKAVQAYPADKIRPGAYTKLRMPDPDQVRPARVQGGRKDRPAGRAFPDWYEKKRSKGQSGN